MPNRTRLTATIERAYRFGTTELDWSGRDITVLPESIGRLTQVQSLSLSRNQLTELPESIGELSQLQRLDLTSNQLKGLPESLGQLTQLVNLSLSDNELTALPESLGQLTQLQSLELSNNQLTVLPESLCQLTQLVNLFLSDNQLTALPESLGQLTQLQGLYLSENQLTALPESLCQLTQLVNLSLSDNQLTTLPESLGQLTHLQRLFLSENQMTALPASLGQLTQLRYIDLSGNQLTALPGSLRILESLERLFLHNNDRLGIPAEVLGPARGEVVAFPRRDLAKPSTILEYYFRLRGGRRPLNEAKLILVGRGAVGKTSIVNRLVHNKFQQEKKTEGINITEWKLQLGAQDVRMNVWDFGGQEIMHATHQFFLTQRSLYLLVLNGRAGGEDTDAEYWLKLIESFGGDSPVIVVLNKIKDHPFDLNRRPLQKKYPIREFVETDCEDGAGIEQLRKIIERETDRLEDLRKDFPADWFKIKDTLSGMKQNYLSFEEFRKICEENGESDGKAQEDLAGFLHRLGIALNYKDDPRFRTRTS